MDLQGRLLPDVVFKLRVRDETVEGPNPYTWDFKNTSEIFDGKRVVVFSLPGAFTPTCSTYQVPGFEKLYDQMKEHHVDEVYCVSVNDAFVMNAWAKDQHVQKVKMLPDGSGHFTKGLDMLVEKDNLGFGMRSWRYAMVVIDGVIEKSFCEPGKVDNAIDDPYGETSPERILSYLAEVAPRFVAKANEKVA